MGYHLWHVWFEDTGLDYEDDPQFKIMDAFGANPAVVETEYMGAQ